MNTIKHVLLKGKESFLDHTKSIALYGKLYWRKSNKKLNVGDIVYLFMSGKGHYQIRYKLEVTNTSVTRQDEVCWLAPFVPDNDCFEFTPVAAMYEGEELGLNELETIGISRHVQYAVLNNEQINFIDKYFEQHYTEMPKEYKGTHKANFQHGEMMLHEDGDNIGQWIEAGMDTLERQNDIRLYKFAKELGKERFGVAYYINELYAKWCPYDNLDWIFEY